MKNERNAPAGIRLRSCVGDAPHLQLQFVRFSVGSELVGSSSLRSFLQHFKVEKGVTFHSIHFKIFPKKMTRLRGATMTGEPRRGRRVVNAMPAVRNEFHTMHILSRIFPSKTVKRLPGALGQQVATKRRIVRTRQKTECRVRKILCRRIDQRLSPRHGTRCCKIVCKKR